MADTTRLTRRVQEGLSPRATGGMTVITYSDMTGPRVLVTVAYGELGQVETRYFLGESGSFASEVEITTFAQPVTMGSPEPVSRVRQTFHFCGDSLLLGEYTKRAESVKTTLREILPSLRGP